ncbi:MAG: undecaprenyl/decaprenyl-phosphate alpha-N-acetylglucosaminyl 1-phosphate transferase [Thermogutta sp.]|nr:undecaprenyl/decaprenyl-phosphate alpha-N-acetylglucosaminyl 1-phosphate transferase [Thermogutta sp.]
MPTSGGLAIWAGIVLPFALATLFTGAVLGAGPAAGLLGPTLRQPLPALLPPDAVVHLPGVWHQAGRLWTVLGIGTVLMLLGLADDVWKLDWRLRLAVEFAAAILTAACGFRVTMFLDLPWLAAAVSVVWIVVMINAFNMLDNMDGLSAGIAAIAAVILALVMLFTPETAGGEPQLFVAGFFLVMVGAIAGFLWHNRPPARLFMGDCGSYWIGYLSAVMSMTATFAGANLPRHAVLAPLCALAVPLYDFTTVVLIRLRAGRSPFVGDKNHFSHRLVELGMTPPQAVLTIYLATAACGLGALLLHQVNAFGAGVILLSVFCMLSLIAILEAAARRQLRRRGNGRAESAANGPSDAALKVASQPRRVESRGEEPRPKYP